MLEAVPSRRWSNSYRLFRDGVLFTEIGPALFCRVEGLTVAGRTRPVRRGRFGLIQMHLPEVNGSLQAQAWGSWSGRGWSIAYYAGHEQSYRLRPRRPLGMTFVLESNGTAVGMIRPQLRGLWCSPIRHVVIDLPDLPLPLVLFAFWLVITPWDNHEGGGGAI
ncbi:hypothetical protein [Thermogemmatispora tikiterensis]|uniref:Uncharacterized protein n=1 Tax=Thermogemmatispora tikiterensis TaxID=1825093 RepID=A0A328VT58_9CHLR|nr:hypothetical protein [Thermogemmatispora tikiterensis]RAQ98474.1 hypothetical protein A4R35_23230 [Thermogemmatispora tikiterensis]